MNSSSPAPAPSWRDRNTLPYRLLIWFMLAAMATVLMAVVTYRASEDRTQAAQQSRAICG